MANIVGLNVLVVLVGLVLVPVQAQENQLDCLDHRSRVGRLELVMSDVVNTHLCGLQEPPIDFEGMMDRCEAFCAPGIPIPVGTDGVGFNITSIDAICMGTVTEGGSEPILRYDPVLMANCADWSTSVQDINLRAADFIAAVTNMTFEQLVYRAAMAQKVADMEVQITSDEVQEEMALERVDRKLERLQGIISDNLADLMQDGMLSRGLNDRLDNLEDKARVLMDVIEDKLPDVRNFTNQCNEVLLGWGLENEYALDICSVTSTECIESEYGQHVGCCCGLIPAVGNFRIAASRDGQDATDALRRRLQQGELADGQELAEEVDVCGKAAEVGAGDLQDTVGRLTSIPGGEELLIAYDDQQRETYPVYYEECPTRRLDTSTSGRPKKTRKSGASRKVPKKKQDEVSGSGKHEWMTEEQQRQLQTYLTCVPPERPTNEDVNQALEVAFWDKTDEALCKNIQIQEEQGGEEVDMTDDHLAALCAGFCAQDSIPFLIGTTSFGFTHAQMDQVCFQPDPDGPVYSQATLDECHDKANIFTRLQQRTASFAQALQELDASRLRFVAYARQAQVELRQVIIENAERELDDARSSQKLAALQDLIRSGLGDILGGQRVKGVFEADAANVATKALELDAELRVAVPGLRSFLDNCNFLTTGVGRSNEYLLDLCSQTSDACIDDSGGEGRHAGCCCGYNPIITLGASGISAGRATIVGSDADILRRGYTEEEEEEVSLELGDVVDICAQSHTAAKSTVDDYEEEILELENIDGQALIDEAQVEKESRYPDLYARCEPPQQRWTWTGAARANVEGVANAVGNFVNSINSSPASRVRPVDVSLLTGVLGCVAVLTRFQ